ncbi:MAG: hypothetical protein NT007_13645 [Candidatus Kapabacteria bacterium]|nr:hypothetical protein [Candidatus Kapabacteria bacterium]
MKKTFYLVLLIFIFQVSASHSLKAQWAIMYTDADSLVILGAKYVYNLQFIEASYCFNRVQQLYPGHPVGYFMDAMVDWWKINLNQDDTQFDKVYLKKIDKVLDVCQKILDTNAKDLNALFFKGGALGYRGRFHAIRKNWLSTASDGKDGLNILIECLKKAPSNPDIMLGTGIYSYFAAKLPEDFPLLKPLMVFLPAGDKKLGILELESSAKYARYTGTEAKVVLQQIYYQFEYDYYKALLISEDLYKQFPNNPYFKKYLARCYSANGRAAEAEILWRDILKSYMEKKFGHTMTVAREALYYIGRNLMMKNDLDNALKYFYKCDEACRELDKSEISGFMVKLNLYVGNIYDLQKKRDLANAQYNKVLQMRDFDGSHYQAKFWLSRAYGQ